MGFRHTLHKRTHLERSHDRGPVIKQKKTFARPPTSNPLTQIDRSPQSRTVSVKQTTITLNIQLFEGPGGGDPVCEEVSFFLDIYVLGCSLHGFVAARRGGAVFVFLFYVLITWLRLRRTSDRSPFVFVPAPDTKRYM